MNDERTCNTCALRHPVSGACETLAGTVFIRNPSSGNELRAVLIPPDNFGCNRWKDGTSNAGMAEPIEHRDGEDVGHVFDERKGI